MSEKLINITIDNKEISVPEGVTILEASKLAGIDIPTLCFLKGINQISDCRMCIVEIEETDEFVTACTHKVEEGMSIKTHSPEIIEARRVILDLIISNHNKDCINCSRLGNCELQALAAKFNIQVPEFQGEKASSFIDDLSPSIVRDSSRCIACRRCVQTCKNVQEIGAIECPNEGFYTTVVPAENCYSMKDTKCVYCGQCIQNCPTGALHEREYIPDVWKKINAPDVHVIVQTAPSIRAALGEEFRMPIGTNVAGKMVTALKKMGFDKVFDTNTGADFTIVEEANEFVRRFENKDNLPMITSCCPAWVRFAELNYPELLPHLSSCKSPHQMLGAVLKSYYAKKEGIDPENICVVSVMPCIAKKYERQRKELSSNGLFDVDFVITTRELAKMIRASGIKFNMLEDSEFDNPLGEASGSGAIFGTSGGVMEAALRTAQDTLTGKSLEKIDFREVRGEKAIKKATVNINGKDIKVVTASGLANARKILEEIKSGKADYQFVEIMACPGGCIMGGGQPIKTANEQSNIDIRKLRSECLYSIDEKSEVRKSHENPFLKNVYSEFLDEPGSYRAEKLLHTKFNNTTNYDI